MSTYPHTNTISELSMVTLYIVCLIFGGTLLSLSLFMGGDHDTDHADFHLGDGDASAELDTGSDVHLEISADADVDADIDTGGDVDVHTDDVHGALQEASGSDTTDVQGQGAAEAFKFISLRSLIFFTAFFGLTGSVLTWLSASAVTAFLSAVGLGGFASVLTHKLMNYLKRTESGETIEIKNLEGHAAKVVLAPSKSAKGKVTVEVQGQTHTLLALVDEQSEKDMLPAGCWGLIVRVERDLAYIIEADYIS